MNGVSGPVSGQQNLSVARQGLQLLQAGEQSRDKATGKAKPDPTKRIAQILNTDPRSPNWRSPVSVLSEITEGILAGIPAGNYQESYAPNGNGFFSPGHLVLNDSDAELNFAQSILAQVNGDGITLNAAQHALLQVNGQNSTVNVGGAFSGLIAGDNSTLNVAGHADLAISGDNVTANVAGTVDAYIKGDNAVLNATTVYNLFVNGDDATVNTHTLAGHHRLYGEDLTLNAEVALGDVRFGAATYFDAIYGREDTSGSGSGDIKLNIGTVEGYAATGDGDEVLTIGTAIGVSAGQGDDIITVGSAQYVSGMDGDDVIKVSNAEIVYGGKGNDQIEVGEGVEQLNFALGDGNYVVTAHSGTTIHLGEISKDKVRISAEDGTYRISFEGSDDSIELRTQDGSTSRVTFSSRLVGAIELKDGKVTYL